MPIPVAGVRVPGGGAHGLGRDVAVGRERVWERAAGGKVRAPHQESRHLVRPATDLFRSLGEVAPDGGVDLLHGSVPQPAGRRPGFQVPSSFRSSSSYDGPVGRASQMARTMFSQVGEPVWNDTWTLGEDLGQPGVGHRRA
jgi:hypothetical protein